MVKVYIEIVKNCPKEELIPIIQSKILENSTIHTDGWRACDGLILNGYDYCRVFHLRNEFVHGRCDVDGIESFWSYSKRRLVKCNGIDYEKFIFYLKDE